MNVPSSYLGHGFHALRSCFTSFDKSLCFSLCRLGLARQVRPPLSRVVLSCVHEDPVFHCHYLPFRGRSSFLFPSTPPNPPVRSYSFSFPLNFFRQITPSSIDDAACGVSCPFSWASSAGPSPDHPLHSLLLYPGAHPLRGPLGPNLTSLPVVPCTYHDLLSHTCSASKAPCRPCFPKEASLAPVVGKWQGHLDHIDRGIFCLHSVCKITSQLWPHAGRPQAVAFL